MNKPPKQIADYKQYKKSREEDKKRIKQHANYLKIMEEMTDRYNKTGTTLTLNQQDEFLEEEIEREEKQLTNNK